MSVFSILVGNKDFMLNKQVKQVHVYHVDEYGYPERQTDATKVEVKKALLKHAQKGHITFSEACEIGSNLTPQGVGNWSF